MEILFHWPEESSPRSGFSATFSVGRGCSLARQLQKRLGISDQTVKFHVAAITGKLGVTNRTEAVSQALRRGLIAL